MVVKQHWTYLLLFTVILAVGCTRPLGVVTPTPTSPLPKITPTPSETLDPTLLAGGLVATFDVVGERFRVWVTNPSTIEQILALHRGAGTAKIPNGRILKGSGQGNHNAPWNWHLDPEDIHMAEFTIEVCDGTPSYVERSLDDFVANLTRYCPWSALLVEIRNYR